MTVSEALARKAAQRCRSLRCEEAIQEWRELIALEPRNCEVYYRLGMCCTGACRAHSLVDPEVAVSYFHSALELAVPPRGELMRARILGALGNTQIRCAGMNYRARLESAVPCYREAAAIYLETRRFEDWAREQNNLGLVLCELAEVSPACWREAVEAFENALLIRTKERDRLAHAATLSNLGTAYRALPGGDRKASIVKAVDCYHRALRICRADTFPGKYAALQNNLANAWLSLPAADTRQRIRNIRAALRHFDLALRVLSKDANRRTYALTQFNRGQAFLQLGDPATGSAIACFRDAEECFARTGQTDMAREAARLCRRCEESSRGHR